MEIDLNNKKKKPGKKVENKTLPEAYVRLTFFRNTPSDKPFKDVGYEELDKEVFFSSLHMEDRDRHGYLDESITENIGNSPEQIIDLLEENSFKDIGIYEILGTYEEEWTGGGGGGVYSDDWDCHWYFSDYEIDQYTEKEMKDYLTDMYDHKERTAAMGIIYDMGFDKDLITLRSNSTDFWELNKIFKDEK